MKMTITERAVIQRIKRRLVQDDERLVKLRGKGTYYTIDAKRNTLIHKISNLEHFAREIGALNEFERLEGAQET